MIKINLTKIKRLNVPSFYRLGKEPYTACDVEIYKEGLYCVGNVCWVELVLNGKWVAYFEDVEMFKYSLQLLNASELNYKKQSVLKELVKQKMATKEQKELVELIRDVKELKDNKREARKLFRRIVRKRDYK